MSECLILNDASLPFSSAEDCEQKLDVFFKILHNANFQGVHFYRADDLEGDWNSLIYADGFEFGQWINKIENKDQCRLVKSVVSKVKCPLISTENMAPENAIKEMLFVLSSDQSIEVRALGVASLKNTYGISFASHPHWEANPVVVVRQWDENGAVQQQTIDVPNVCSLAHLDDVSPGIF